MLNAALGSGFDPSSDLNHYAPLNIDSYSDRDSGYFGSGSSLDSDDPDCGPNLECPRFGL